MHIAERNRYLKVDKKKGRKNKRQKRGRAEEIRVLMLAPKLITGYKRRKFRHSDRRVNMSSAQQSARKLKMARRCAGEGKHFKNANDSTNKTRIKCYSLEPPEKRL